MAWPFIVVFVVGAVFGAILFHTIDRLGTVGNLRIDHSDPEDGPYMFLESYESVSKLSSKRYAVLRVVVDDYLPRK